LSPDLKEEAFYSFHQTSDDENREDEGMCLDERAKSEFVNNEPLIQQFPDYNDPITPPD
jgi:hypothetical protein